MHKLTKRLKQLRPDDIPLKAFARQHAASHLHEPKRTTLQKAAWHFLAQEYGSEKAERIVNERLILAEIAEHEAEESAA